MTSTDETRPPRPRGSLNARVAAATLAVGAVALHSVNQLDHALLPMRLLIIGLLVVGAWALSDEMGLRRPLNRVAFVAFGFAMTALAVAVLEPAGVDASRYVLIYAFALLLAVLVWSVAFVHRQPDLRRLGLLGASASLLPLALIVAGHLLVGLGAWTGASGLLALSEGGAALGTSPMNVIEAVFVVFCLLAAVFLWRGRMDADLAR